VIRTLGIVISFLFSMVAAAQDSGAPRVLIPLLILDSHHRPVTGVTADALVITEHKIPITISAVLSSATLP